MTFSLFGLTVKRETEILALAAFLLSITGLTLQVRNHLRGSEVRTFPPEQVLIIRDGPNGTPLISATLAYVNEGAPGYGAVAHHESVHFQLAGHDYEQQWQQFVSFNSVDNILTPVNPVDSAPFLIEGGGALSHNTLFAPRAIRDPKDRYRNFIKWDAFLAALAAERRLVLDFSSDVSGESQPLRQRVVIDIDDNLLARLKEKGYSAPSCWPEPSAGAPRK